MTKNSKKPVKRIIAIVILIILLIGVLATLFWVTLGGNMNSQAVAVADNIIAKQTEVEQDITVDGYTIDQPNVIVNPYGNSPLTALVAFHTDRQVAPTVVINGRDELSTFSHTFEPATDHYLPIYGLYADTDNQITISYSDNGQTTTKTINVTTDPLPNDLALPTEVIADKTQLTNDLYFFTPSSQGYAVAYDVNGDVRWYLSQQATWKIDRLANGHLLVSTDRLVNQPYYTTGLYEMNLLGKIYVEYSLPGGYHHDYFEMPNGNLLVATNDFNNVHGTVEDVIVELDRQTGNIVKTFDLKNVLPMEDGKSENWSNYDWFHNNSVWYDDKTNSVILSGRHQDAVIALDYTTGQLKWIIGDPTNWSDEYQKYFFTPIGDNFEWQWSQHATMVTPDGYIFLFDNGNNKSKIADNYVPAQDSYSRGVMYKIDTNNMTIEQVWQYGKERGSDFYSPYISDVDYIDTNHYIIHSGGIVKVDGQPSNQPAGLSDGNTALLSDTAELINDQVVFEIKLPTNNYRVEKMSPYTNNDSYQPGEAKQLGSLGVTKPDEQKTALAMTGHKPDDAYNSHHIELSQERDRLVVKGQFKRGQEVGVILRQGIKNQYYNIRVSKKPYTAMCVDLWSEEETRDGIVVTKYINREGLSGRYNIYISIDGTVYNTEQYVEF